MQIKDYQIAVLGIFLALGSVCSAYVLSEAVIKFQKMQTQTIRATGSASRNITSDRASWSFQVKTQKPSLKEGYAKINADTKKACDFLISNGIDEKDIETASVNSYENYRRTPNGSMTNDIESYNLYRYIKVKSNDIKKITEISKQADKLAAEDIIISSDNVEYYVSNLDELKVEMAGEAAKNAQRRAESIIAGTNGQIGVMTNAKLGVFQIVPADSTEVSDYGINDTSSIEKKITASVSASFTVK